MSEDEGNDAGAAPDATRTEGQDRPLDPASAELAAGTIRGWGNGPARDPDFTGREEHLAAIGAGLLAGGPVVVHAERGMGGAGKSQVAVEYAHRHAGDYALTWWLDGENTVLLGQQYAELAIHLGHVTRDAPPEEMRRAAISALQQHPSWLLVFDNVPDWANFQKWLPGGPGHVLITSYRDDWGRLATAVPVGPLPRAESVQLLRRRVPGFADGDASALADALGDLPLSLALASAAIAETGMPPAEYVRLHAEYGINLTRAGMTWGPRDSLTPVVSYAWTRLRFVDPDAALLAAICARLAHWPVPVGWLTTAAADLPAALAARLTDDLARPRLLDALTRSGLVRLDEAGLTMHRLVQNSIGRAIPDVQTEARACATTIITANVPPDSGSPAAWPAWARLYPHLPVLPPRRQDTGPTLDDAALTAVWYLISSGNASEAETRASRLHESWESPHALGPDHEDTLRAAAACAAANRALGRYGVAWHYGTRALARRRSLHGDDHPGTLTAASDLAGIMSDMGNHEAARELDADTLRRRRRVLGKDHPDTRRSAGNLARDLRALGETGWRGWRAGLRRRVTTWWRAWPGRHRAG
jgi:hypothetical protein